MLCKCQSHRKEINSFLQLSLQRHRNKLPPNIGVLCNYCGAILSLPLQWMAIMHESELNLCESSFDQNIFTCQDISMKSGWKSNKDYFNIIRKSAASSKQFRKCYPKIFAIDKYIYICTWIKWDDKGLFIFWRWIGFFFQALIRAEFKIPTRLQFQWGKSEDEGNCAFILAIHYCSILTSSTQLCVINSRLSVSSRLHVFHFNVQWHFDCRPEGQKIFNVIKNASQSPVASRWRRSGSSAVGAMETAGGWRVKKMMNCESVCSASPDKSSRRCETLT